MGLPHRADESVRQDNAASGALANVRSFHVAVADQATVQGIVAANIAKEKQLHREWLSCRRLRLQG